MFFSINRKIGEKDLEVSLLNLLAVFSLFRTNFSSGKYLFLLLYAATVFYFLLKFRRVFFNDFKYFVRSYYLIFLLFSIFLISYFASVNYSKIILLDLAGGLALLPVIYMYTVSTRSVSDFDFAIRNFGKVLVIFAFAVIIKIYINIFDIFQWVPLSPYLMTNTDADKYFVAVDNNFGILPVIFGTVILFIYTIRKRSFPSSLVVNLLMLVFTLSIFISGTRRGMVFLVIFLLLVLSFQIIPLFAKTPEFKKTGSRTLGYLVSLFFVIIISWSFFRFTSNHFKNRVLEMTGSTNLLDTKFKLTAVFLKYQLILGKELSFTEEYNRLWTPTFDPDDPESSWGFRNHKTVYPLTGKNSEIVPKTAKGYLLDNLTNASIEPGYCDAYSLLGNLITSEGDKYKAWVYCYVSNDFDGDIVGLSVGTDWIIKGLVSGDPYEMYDLSTRGEWKKIEISFEAKAGNVPVFLGVVKKNTQTFSNLRGYVIFASPHIEKINQNQSLVPATSTESVGVRNKFVIHSSLMFNDCGFFNSLSEMDFNYPFHGILTKFSRIDTTHLNYHKNLIHESKLSRMGDERIRRWAFALQVFRNEYGLKKKMLGGGFDHLHWYGDYFLHDRTKIDWPHNPFLSILLYSGIIGLLIYLFFLYKVFYYYIKYRKEYPLLFIFFLITFFFAFFSSGSPFDPPVFGFFSILPFFIHSVHKREESQKLKNADNPE